MPPEPGFHVRRTAGPLSAYVGVWIVLAAGVCLTGLAGWSSARWVTSGARHRFETEAQRIHQELDSYFERLVGTMLLIREGAKSGTYSSRTDWDRLVGSVPLNGDFPAVTFIAIAEQMRYEDRAIREARWQGEYGIGFRIHPDVPIPQRNPMLNELTNFVMPLIYVRPEGLPFDSLDSHHGLDLTAISAGHGLHDVLAHKIASAIGRLPLSLYPIALSSLESPAEATTRLPITVRMQWQDALPARGQRQGLLICAVDMTHLFAGAFEKSPPEFGLRMMLTIPDGGVPTPIYCTDQTWPLTSEQPAPWLRTSDTVMLYQNRLRCDFWTIPQFDRNNYRHAWWLVALAGITLTLLTAGFVTAQIRARLRQAEIAEELRVSNVQLAAAARERARLSRDLHDGTIQSLYALGLELTHAKALVTTSPAQAEAELGHSLSALQAVVNELRQFVLELEPEMFEGQTVRTALEQLVARLRRTTPLAIQFDIALEADAMRPKSAIHVLNLVREALANTLRHAGARNVRVALEAVGVDWRLTVRDDGSGFETEAVRQRSGRGLRSFEERSMELGGRCVLTSAPGEGAQVQVWFPRTETKSAT